jgi:hypothetical protein
MSAAATQAPSWLAEANRLADAFAKKHGHMLGLSERHLSAAFEVGSLHALLRYYESQKYVLEPANLTASGEYRYLTSPNGNPENFSYVRARGSDGPFEIRQQVRVESHVDERICFTPDIVVMVEGADIKSSRDKNYASGKRPFFRVSSSEIVAAHECKSMNPFPELIVSFIGMLVVAHEWYPNGSAVELTRGRGHLAPTLFVGGTARGLHLRMITAMQESYAMNIVCGLHEGTWGLSEAENRLLWRRAQTSAKIALDEENLPF